MKKKLLITLGDSLTEGVGCYDMSKMPHGVKYNGLEKEDKEYQEERFHRLGWPNHVGRALGFDKVINLGYGGTSNCYSAKMLIERVLPNSDWMSNDIYILWMSTEPTRFSFFDGIYLKSFKPGFGSDAKYLSHSYLRSIKNYELGSLNEQVFYTKVIEQVCEHNGFKLAIVHWSNTLKNLYHLYPSPYFLFPPPAIIGRSNLISPQDFSPICRHPNESGYKKIADTIVDGIKNSREEFVVGSPKTEIEWEWRGSNEFPEKNLKVEFSHNTRLF